MEGYKEIFSTNNIIQLNQIEQAFTSNGINIQTKGKKALEIGSIEVTGIRGASILVPEQQVFDARNILKQLGIDDEISDSKPNELRPLIIGLGVLLVAVVVYMILAALNIV